MRAGDCPVGDDELVSGTSNEVQLFNCAGVAASSFYLMYKQQMTAPILKTGSAADVQTALMNLPTMKGIRVTLNGKLVDNVTPVSAVCDSRAIVAITFLQEYGK